jgi:hypothetical protein
VAGSELNRIIIHQTSKNRKKQKENIGNFLEENSSDEFKFKFHIAGT